MQRSLLEIRALKKPTLVGFLFFLLGYIAWTNANCFTFPAENVLWAVGLVSMDYGLALEFAAGLHFGLEIYSIIAYDLPRRSEKKV